MRVWVKKENTGKWSRLGTGNKTSHQQTGEAKTLASNGARLGKVGRCV